MLHLDVFWFDFDDFIFFSNFEDFKPGTKPNTEQTITNLTRVLWSTIKVQIFLCMIFYLEMHEQQTHVRSLRNRPIWFECEDADYLYVLRRGLSSPGCLGYWASFDWSRQQRESDGDPNPSRLCGETQVVFVDDVWFLMNMEQSVMLSKGFDSCQMKKEALTVYWWKQGQCVSVH